MTIKEARKNLGKLACNITDNEILNEIESATLLKDLFFNLYLKNKKTIVVKSN